jgi:hypothetical protein
MTLVAWNIRLIVTYGILNRHEVNGLGAEYVREDCGLLLGVGRGRNPDVLLRFRTSQLDTKAGTPMFVK